MLQSEEKQAISRRDALKNLAAVTGAVTLATLPNQWEKPLIEVGVLPAHAQTSSTIPLTLAVNYSLQGGINNCSNNTGTNYNLAISYQDTGGNVSNTSTLELISTFNPSGATGFTYNGPLSGWPGSWSGGANTGILTIGLCTTFGSATSNTISVTLTDDTGLSTSVSDTENRPVGANETNGSPSQLVL